VTVLASALLLALVLPPSQASAQADGAVRVTVRAPEGVPANVVLSGVAAGGPARRIAAKPPAGTSTTTTLTLPIGAATVSAPRVTVDGVAYVARPVLPAVPVVPRTPTVLDVTYVAEGGATQLRATAVDQTSVSLAWTAPPGSLFTLRRTTGGSAVTLPTQGVNVPVSGTTAVDKGLKPGTQYSYALFTILKGRLYGPLTAVAGTAPPAGSTDAAYIASPSTLLAKAADIASAKTTGAGVEVVLQGQVPPPLVGAGVVLPISAALPGGFLGVVTTVSADGRSVALTAGGLSDAFDYYELNVEDFSVGAAALPAEAAAPPSAAALPAPLAKTTAPQATAAKPTEADRREATPEESPRGAAVAPSAAPAPGPSAKAAVDSSCSGEGGQKVTFKPGVGLSGHLRTKLDKKGFLGKDSEATLDMAIKVTVTGAADIETSGSYGCSVELKLPPKVLTTYPVPISAMLTPSARFAIEGKTTVGNLGMTATGGVAVAGSMSLKNGPSFTGKTIADVVPSIPKVSANGGVGLKVGGDLVVGPGAGTPDAGVIAGVSGQIYPIDAGFAPKFPAPDPRFNNCIEFKLAFTAGLGLTAKAWLNGWSHSKTITVDALNGTFNYPGSPRYLPAGCNKLPGGGSPDSLLGPGVTKVDDTVVGDPAQWDHVDGFAPGAKTWVLSTGLVANAVGTPDKFASKNMGRPGDPELTTLAGFPTFDAASYQVTLVPTGSTLHVNYVFASEEYPEYVGSNFNDVMVVRVDGKNCATVPGTTQAVAVNTINAETNSKYYVDNAAGAAGYSTTMDGLTVPLTCDVPVTPGKAVTVQIAVADTSDHVYDSAVALVDGGIWTD